MKKLSYTLYVLLLFTILASCSKHNSNFNDKKNDYFIIREPDSVFFSKKGQQALLKDYNTIIFENRENNEKKGIDYFFKEIDKKINNTNNSSIDILYARPMPIDNATFHWNVFSIYKDAKNNILYLISNDNDKKATEMIKLLDIFKHKYKNIKIIFLPQIQYSYKGCSIKGAMFVKELHKNNNELLRTLLKISKQYNKTELSIRELINNNLIESGDKTIIVKRYLKFIQKDSDYYNFIKQKLIKNKHNNRTKIKTDKKTGKDIYIKNSKLHDKGYSYIYNVLLNDKNLVKNDIITKKEILKINNSFYKNNIL